MRKYKTSIRKSKIKRLGIILSISCIAISLVSIITLSLFDRPEIKNLNITNQTPNSATITWTTNKPSYAQIIVSEENNFYPIIDNQFKTKYYDDRDIIQNEFGDYIIRDGGKQKRITHHVTIRDLDPNKEYFIKIINGLLDSKSSVQQVNTIKVSDQINIPDVAYGSIITENPKDTIFKYRVVDENNNIISKTYSTTPNKEGRWAIDISQFYSDSLGYFEPDKDNHSLSIELISYENTLNQVYEIKEYKPLSTIVFNKKIINDEEFQNRTDPDNVGFIKYESNLDKSLLSKIHAAEELGDWYVRCSNPEGSTFREKGGVESYVIQASGSSNPDDWSTMEIIQGFENWADNQCATFFVICKDRLNGANCGDVGGGSQFNTAEVRSSFGCTNSETLLGQYCLLPPGGGYWVGGSSGLCNFCANIPGTPPHGGRFCGVHTNIDTNLSNVSEYDCTQFQGILIDPNNVLTPTEEPPSVDSRRCRKPGNESNSFEVGTCFKQSTNLSYACCDQYTNELYSCVNSRWEREGTTSDCNIPTPEPSPTQPTPTLTSTSQPSPTPQKGGGTKIIQPEPTVLPTTTPPPASDGSCILGLVQDHINSFPYPDEIMNDSNYTSFILPGGGYDPLVGKMGVDFGLNEYPLASVESIENGKVINFIGTNNKGEEILCDNSIGLYCEYGQAVMIQHADAVTVYSNLNGILPISIGECVNTGQRLGIVQNSLNLEIRQVNYLDGSNIGYLTTSLGNPLDFIGDQTVYNQPLYENQGNAEIDFEYNLFTNISAQEETNSSQNSNYYTKLSPGAYFLSFQNTNLSSPIERVIISEDLPKGAIIRQFVDENRNGTKDPEEDFLTTSSIQLEIQQEAESFSYNLDFGWNSITFPFVTDEFDTADELLDLMRSQGVMVTEINRLKNNIFEPFIKREDGQVYDDDTFHIVPGEGYVVRVKSLDPGQVTFSGNNILSSVPSYLENGWNLIGTNVEDYTAERYIDSCVESNINCDTFSAFRGGLYTPLIVKEDDTLFGNDFDLNKKEAYFVRVENNGGRLFTPE